MTSQGRLPGVQRRRLVRRLPPFAVSPNAFRDCAVKWKPDEEFQPDETPHYINKEILQSEPLTPKFRLDIDYPALESETGLDLDDIELVLAARDLDFKKYMVMARWPVREAPPVWDPPPELWESLKSSGGIEFHITACLKNGLQPGNQSAYRPGSILAQKKFPVRPTSDNASFPTKFWDFENDNRYQNDTLWLVDYLGGAEPDFTRPAMEILEVKINQRVKAHLERLRGANRVEDTLVRMMASEIFISIARRALSEIPEDGAGEEEGVRGRILGQLMDFTDASEDEIIEWAQESDDGHLRSVVQAMLSVIEPMSRR